MTRDSDTHPCNGDACGSVPWVARAEGIAQPIAMYACFCGYQSEGDKPDSCELCGGEMREWRTRQPHVFQGALPNQHTTRGQG